MPSDSSSAHHPSGASQAGEPAMSQDKVASAKYIAAMARELQIVARRSDLELMAYFLDMIVHEADLVMKGDSSGK